MCTIHDALKTFNFKLKHKDKIVKAWKVVQIVKGKLVSPYRHYQYRKHNKTDWHLITVFVKSGFHCFMRREDARNLIKSFYNPDLIDKYKVVPVYIKEKYIFSVGKTLIGDEDLDKTQSIVCSEFTF